MCAIGLYLYFFKLEVAYTKKIRDRRNILGLSKPNNDGSETKDPLDLIAAATAAATQLSSATGDDTKDGSTPKTNAEKTTTINASERAILSGVLPMAIFRNALRVPSLATDLQLRLQFLASIPHSANPRYPRSKLEKTLRKIAKSAAASSTSGATIKTEVDANGETKAVVDGAAATTTTESKKRRRSGDDEEDNGNGDEKETKTDNSNGDNVVSDDDDDEDDTKESSSNNSNDSGNTTPLDTSSMSNESLVSQASVDADLLPLCQQIIDSLSKDFPTSPQVWRVRALWQVALARQSRATSSSDSDTSSLVEIEKVALTEWEAAVNVPDADSDMWMAYAQYFHDRLQYYSNVVATSSSSSTSTVVSANGKKGKRAKAEPTSVTTGRNGISINDDERKAVCEWLVARVLEVCEMAMQLSKLTPQLLIMWATLLLQCNSNFQLSITLPSSILNCSLLLLS
jgi:hypothetical protein